MHSSITMLSLFTTLLTFCLLTSSTVAQLCYRPNGQVDSSDYQPCNKGKVSMCCATNRTDNYLNICTSNGLCQESGTQAQPGANTIWREGCTDPTWKDPACIRLCADGFERNLLSDLQRTNMTTTHMVITKCSDGSLCCGEGNTACCIANQGVWLQNGVVYSTNPNATSTSSATATSPTGTTTSSAISSSSQDSGGLATSAKIAIAVVATIIGLVLLAIVSVCVYRARRRRRAATNPVDGAGGSGAEVYTQQEQYSELSGQPAMVAVPPAEKDSGQNTFVAELPGDRTETGYRRVPQVP